MTISGRGLGKKQKVILDDFSVPFPPEFGDGGGLTLRDLIGRIVVSEVEAFTVRQEKRRLTRVMSSDQIEDGLVKGKVEMGGSGLEQKVDVNEAIAAALQAFEDRFSRDKRWRC